MKVPQKTERDDERKKKFRAVLIRNTAIIIIPSLIFAMKMVEKEKEDTTELIGISGISVDLGKLMNKSGVIYPEVSEVSAGYLKEWDSSEEKQHENLNVIVYLSKDISADKKNKIKEFIDVETKFDKIQFIVKIKFQKFNRIIKRDIAVLAVSRFLYLYYIKSNKLTAISIIPEIKPYTERWCSPYSLAAGSNSSNDINTIIPATDANII